MKEAPGRIAPGLLQWEDYWDSRKDTLALALRSASVPRRSSSVSVGKAMSTIPNKGPLDACTKEDSSSLPASSLITNRSPLTTGTCWPWRPNDSVGDDRTRIDSQPSMTSADCTSSGSPSAWMTCARPRNKLLPTSKSPKPCRSSPRAPREGMPRPPNVHLSPGRSSSSASTGGFRYPTLNRTH